MTAVTAGKMASVTTGKVGNAAVSLTGGNTLKGSANGVGSGTSWTGQMVQIGTTTYIFVASTAKTNPTSTVTKLSVNEAVAALSTGSQVAFSSMDAMMAAIKHKYGEDIKTVTSFTEGTQVSLKFDAFADVNDAIDLSLHVGADSSDDNKIAMNIAQMSARALGVNGLDVSGDNDDNATRAIDIIADALQKVSDQRATLGAVQNRLEHTINNLDNVVENTTSAESAIRDTDMATQMVTYSNNQILAQAGQAMLAQSNQSNQGVLSLLG